MTICPVVALKDICTRKGEYGVGLASRPWEPGDPRYIRITDVTSAGGLTSKQVAPSGSESEWSRAILEPGDLLFARSGATVGKTYLHSVKNDPAVYAGYLIRFRLDPAVADSRFVFHYSQTTAYQAWVRSTQRAVAQPNINAQQYGDLPVPLPPLSEQRRITAILDQAELLTRLRGAASSGIGSLTPSIFLEMFGDPTATPPDWKMARLSDFLSSIESGTSPVCQSRPAASGEFGVLKLSALTSGHYRPNENKYLRDEDVPPGKLEVKPGDILFTRKNTKNLVGACIYVENTPPKLLLPDLVFRLNIRDHTTVKPRYLQALLMDARMRRQVQNLASGSSGSMPNISKSNLMKLRVPLPPIGLQEEFDRRASHIDGLARRNSKTSDEVAALVCSLRSRAFRGEL